MSKGLPNARLMSFCISFLALAIPPVVNANCFVHKSICPADSMEDLATEASPPTKGWNILAICCIPIAAIVNLNIPSVDLSNILFNVSNSAFPVRISLRFMCMDSVMRCVCLFTFSCLDAAASCAAPIPLISF